MMYPFVEILTNGAFVHDVFVNTHTQHTMIKQFWIKEWEGK